MTASPTVAGLCTREDRSPVVVAVDFGMNAWGDTLL
jgi:hypothetical protein